MARYLEIVALATGMLDARRAAQVARDLLADDSAALLGAWRFALKQLIDDYETTRRYDGPEAAERLFAEPPASSGSCQFDAALAALAEHLARRDRWRPPEWAFEEWRYAEPFWFVDGLRSLRATALVQSPLAFRKRGVFICDGALSRV